MKSTLGDALHDRVREDEGRLGSRPAYARGILMSVLHTLKKRQVEVVAHLKGVLGQPAIDILQAPFPLLFPTGPP